VALLNVLITQNRTCPANEQDSGGVSIYGMPVLLYQETYTTEMDTQAEVSNIPDPSTLYIECWLYQHNILMMLSSKTNLHHIVEGPVMQKFTYNKPVAPW